MREQNEKCIGQNEMRAYKADCETQMGEGLSGAAGKKWRGK